METLADEAVSDEQIEPVWLAIFNYAYHFAAWDWFTEQVENPQLVLNRGGKIAEPLPRHLGLFDEQGLPLTLQKRENLVRLQQWANDDDHWLAWVFPDGLSAADEAQLRTDLAELKTHNWSPHGFMQAVLADWPEDQPEQNWDLAAREQAMIATCQAFIAQHKHAEGD